MNPAEEWRPVTGFEGLYEVSNYGRVRSLTRKVSDRAGVFRTVSGRILKIQNKGPGRPRVGLYRNSKIKVGKIHRLVAEAFIPNPDNHPVVRHLNDNPLDNRIENLAWGTKKDNTQDMIRLGNHNNQRKTHCMRGHLFSPDNTNIIRGGGRSCRKCKKMHDLKRRKGIPDG